MLPALSYMDRKENSKETNVNRAYGVRVCVSHRVCEKTARRAGGRTDHASNTGPNAHRMRIVAT